MPCKIVGGTKVPGNEKSWERRFLETKGPPNESGSYFTTFSNVSIFTMDTNIFKLHYYAVFLVGVLRLIQ